MPYLLNVAYAFCLLVLSPWLLVQAFTKGKYRRGLRDKFLGSAFEREGSARCAWFHGVSVGEVHLLRQVIAAFRQRHPDWTCAVSTTTDTGYDECVKAFPDLHVFYWPLDFSWSVRTALANVRPDLIVLAESELWPNFLIAAKEQGVPVVVVNARMSPRSARRFQRFQFLGNMLLSKLALVNVQNETYAESFRLAGLDPDRIHVTGSVKFDGVSCGRDNSRTRQLGSLLDVEKDDLIWIAGSTQAPEEEIVINIYRVAKIEHPNLRLFLVPRQRDRFDEVANLLHKSRLPFVRRSTLAAPVTDRPSIILMDTIGELGALWGLASLAFVGGSLDGKRGGQNMIEPAGYGAAVVFGPHVWNFQEIATRLVDQGAALQVGDAAELQQTVLRLLNDESERDRRGALAQVYVRRQQGATERTLDAIDGLIPSADQRVEAA